jgi:hypothetical protein
MCSSAPIPETPTAPSELGFSNIPWKWIVHLVHKNQDCQAQLDEKEELLREELLKAEPLPQPEPLEGVQIRDRRFVSAFLPQIDARIWEWIQQLFQGYREATDVLTPLENDTWTAEVILQATNAVSRRKREVQTRNPVSTMMDILELPLFQNRTLISPIQGNSTMTSQKVENSTEGLPRFQILVRQGPLDDPWDLGTVAIIFVIACVVASVAGLAGKKEREREMKPDRELLLIVETNGPENDSTGSSETLQDCENCDFHLDYPMVHLPEKP